MKMLYEQELQCESIGRPGESQREQSMPPGFYGLLVIGENSKVLGRVGFFEM